MKKILVVDPSDDNLLDQLILWLSGLNCIKETTIELWDLPQLVSNNKIDLAIIIVDMANIGVVSSAISFLKEKKIPVIAIMSDACYHKTNADTSLNLRDAPDSLLDSIRSLL